MKAKLQLPKTIYVTREGEPGEDYLNTGEKPADVAGAIGETVTAGVYQFVKTVKIRLRVEEE